MEVLCWSWRGPVSANPFSLLKLSWWDRKEKGQMDIAFNQFGDVKYLLCLLCGKPHNRSKCSKFVSSSNLSRVRTPTSYGWVIFQGEPITLLIRSVFRPLLKPTAFHTIAISLSLLCLICFNCFMMTQLWKSIRYQKSKFDFNKIISTLEGLPTTYPVNTSSREN